MKRIDFESEWNEKYNIGLFRFAGMVGIDRGCGMVWEYDDWIIKSDVEPEFDASMKLLHLPGGNSNHDKNTLVLKKEHFDTVIKILNAFNKAHAEVSMFAKLRMVQGDIACMTNWLNLELDKFDDDEIKNSPEAFDWGSVETLVEIRNKIMEILCFISGIDAAEIETSIADLQCEAVAKRNG